ATLSGGINRYFIYSFFRDKLRLLPGSDRLLTEFRLRSDCCSGFNWAAKPCQQFQLTAKN
ncbi:MAG TPA: hypothetical protein VF679_04985, partial [Pedobacter sp.]